MESIQSGAETASEGVETARTVNTEKARCRPFDLLPRQRVRGGPRHAEPPADLADRDGLALGPHGGDGVGYKLAAGPLAPIRADADLVPVS